MTVKMIKNEILPYRILHTLENFYVIQRYVCYPDVTMYECIVHSAEEGVFLWETRELAAAYLCGLSKNWIHPLRMHQAMCLVIEESEL